MYNFRNYCLAYGMFINTPLPWFRFYKSKTNNKPFFGYETFAS